VFPGADNLPQAEPPEQPGPASTQGTGAGDAACPLSHEALLAATAEATALSGGVGRLEGVGPVTLGHVRRFLADTACDVRVQPVIDLQDTPPADGYEIPARIREATWSLTPEPNTSAAAHSRDESGGRRRHRDTRSSRLPRHQGLAEHSDAAIHAILTFAETQSSVNGTGKGGSKKAKEWKGHHKVQ
jgi:hypothetical protein